MMNRYFLRLAVTAVTAASAVAACAPVLCAQDVSQNNGNAAGSVLNVPAKLEKLSSQLQLTAAQQEQIKPILFQEAAQMRVANSNPSKPPQQLTLEMKQIGETTDNRVKPILSHEQYEKWQQIRARERLQMKQKILNHQSG
jgi:hypothetical protein